MKIFLCSYSTFSLAIPMDFVSSIFLCMDKTEKKIEKKSENGGTFISLPIFFNCPQLEIHHGIILKNGSSDDDNIFADKTILLGTEVESENEIPSGKYYPLPKILDSMHFSSFFNGMFFYSQFTDENKTQGKTADNLVLLLNPQSLTKYIKKELMQ